MIESLVETKIFSNGTVISEFSGCSDFPECYDNLARYTQNSGKFPFHSPSHTEFPEFLVDWKASIVY